MSILSVLKNYAGIIENSDIQPSEFWHCLDSWHEQRNSIKVEHINQFPIKLYDDIRTNESKVGSHLFDLANQYMASIAQDMWKQSIAKKDFNYQLYVLDHQDQYQNLIDAVKFDLKEYAKNTSYGPINKETIRELLDIIASTGYNINPIIYDVRNIFIQSSTIDVKKFVYFGDILFQYGNLNNKQGALRGVVPTEILGNREVLNIIMNNANAFRELLFSTPEPERDEHIAKLKALRNGEYAHDKPITDFIESLGI